MVIYVLEGPDFAGKSTLARALQDRRQAAGGQAEINHAGPPSGEINLFGHYVGQVVAAAQRNESGGFDTVFDRLHVGEFIYGPLYRGVSLISIQQLRSIGQMLDSLDAIKVHVDAPDSELLSRYRGTRPETLVTEESDLLRIAGDYRDLLDQEDQVLEHPWTLWLPGDGLPTS